MKIGINFTHYIKGKVGGIGIYMKSLLHYFPIISPSDEFYAICLPTATKELSKYKNIKIIEIPAQNNPEDLSKLLTHTINLYGFDTWYSPLLILDPLDCPVACAFNIPDMQHEYFPHFFDKNTLEWRRKYFQQSADSCNAIITLSKYSKQDIIRHLNVNPKKVHVVYLDIPPWFKQKTYNNGKILKKFFLEKQKYLFYPANTWPHKNHLRLLEAFSHIKNKFKNVKLVFTGYSYNFNNINKSIIKFNLQDRIKYLGYIEDKEIPAIYKNAIGLVFPSLFEGFGIPLLEAMKTNCPILCSNTTSIPEVAGNAALYFDPLSITDIVDKLNQFLSSKKLRQELMKKGNKQIKKFSYKKTTKKTLEILKKITREENYKLNIPKNNSWPKISIITPSYNQGKYIERTIKSILDQKYPNLEYIVMDGGSTDNTIDILKKYSNQIDWTSKKDKGQTAAINEGIKKSTGEILAYLNSDDTYEKDTLKTIAKFFLDNPKENFVYGKGKHIDENNNYIEDYPNQPTNFKHLHGPCPICQPTAFWKRKILNDIGTFDDSLNYAMDYDYWIRVSKKYKLNYLNKYLANTRLYKDTKTLGQRIPMHKEIIKVQQKHYKTVSQHWILAMVHIELGKLKRDTVLKNTYFLAYIILKSFFYFIKYNHQLPPKKVLNLYLIWIKEIFTFIVKKKYKSFF